MDWEDRRRRENAHRQAGGYGDWGYENSSDEDSRAIGTKNDFNDDDDDDNFEDEDSDEEEDEWNITRIIPC